MIIDTHHHFWNYNPVEFDWIDDEMAAIRKNFLPEDLASTIHNSGVDGVVTVQARQCLEETDWLLQLASENEFIKGVVGWLPLANKNIQTILDQYSGNRWLKGVRHIVQGEPDPEFILGEAFNQGVSLLKEYGLVYDILILEHQLANTIRFVDRHPDQQFVVDHIAKPKIKTNEIQPWQNLLKELARRENVSCKISGMVTEADYEHWTEVQLQPYFDAVLEAFGPARLMFGSDWPVCQVATNYSEWLQLVKRQVSTLSSEEQNLIFYHNALKAYQL
ncbi:amidohydrolase family protein [uncultured Sunxiuqinia sp.]|uniref:amidohydrolase family protein n=1 Tax=uncultured Sunxiuqinia sp. TaxID=1573825 RepID=UPI0026398BFC|nr:amidohydrolase family protein [uncultured Sunxiuqinia sp.]